ncbi:MAG: hypothetical protein M0036_14100 [Desulfobacteraceae bacterium]|nr:hypothetical protein [Desulfobacteraceae bacterium]
MRELLAQAADYIDRIRGEGPDATYGCHCDLEPDQAPDECVIDAGRANDCVYAGQLVKAGKGRQDCKYWQAIKGAMAVKQETR